MGQMKGWFITFEGPEGSGKSTQIKKTAGYLQKLGKKVMVLREPGGTVISEAIRAILLDPHHVSMCRETELLLYLAARAQILREKIFPAMRSGVVVLLDRYEDSTFAYQCFGREIPFKTVETVSFLLVRGGLKPDITFLLDIDPASGMRRGGRTDRLEKESLGFHRKVRQGFLLLARRDPKRFTVIRADQSKQRVFELIKERLDRAFS